MRKLLEESRRETTMVRTRVRAAVMERGVTLQTHVKGGTDKNC